MAALAELKLDQVGGGLYGGQTGRQQRCCVLARNDLRAHAEMRQIGVKTLVATTIVTQTLARKALGGGTPAVRHAS